VIEVEVTTNDDNISTRQDKSDEEQVIEVEVTTTTSRGRVTRRDPKVHACIGAQNQRGKKRKKML
jgi:hypothetical protein